MSSEETIAFLEGHEDECFALAKQLARAISYENGDELNALRMMTLLEPLIQDRRRLDWLMSAASWSAVGPNNLQYRFTAPRPHQRCSIDIRAAIDAAIKL